MIYTSNVLDISNSNNSETNAVKSLCDLLFKTTKCYFNYDNTSLVLFTLSYWISW
jgi:hypothetical protein